MWLFLLLATASAHTLTSLLNITCNGAQCDLFAGTDSGAAAPLRLLIHSPQTIRFWLALDGNFSEATGMGSDVLIGQPTPGITAQLRDAGAYYELTQSPAPSPSVVVRLQKAPLLLTLLVGGSPVLQEAAPLSWNDTSSWQTLARDATPPPPGQSLEHYFGGGMQNGRFAHRDNMIYVDVGYDWDDGGHPNPVPFFISSAGYAVLRNTWAPGGYTFGAPVQVVHNESTRLDAYYMVAAPGAGAMQSLLGLYTQLTGPPFLPPIYGLFLGDSDCYHNERHGNSTQVAVAVGELYRQYDMPSGWLLPNDGYGCGYGEGPEVFPHNLTDLTSVVAQLQKLGIKTGLWTSTGMPNIAAEVGVAGTRICKTDVGWIGAGYAYAFDGVSLCAGGIEQYSTPPARRFVWTVEGWAGTHRLAVMWTGDDSGSMDYVRWQIPTFVGSGFSAQAHVSGDIDGIFGGSPESYVRDLQFKALTSVLMTMSGWASNADKQPWTWGEPYTTYNRASLKLKSRLTPYMYSLSRQAYDTGVPPIRALLLEFPEEEYLYLPSNATSYTFLSGPSLLVAPVYTLGATTRDDIYLPNNTLWADWWNGTIYEGGQTLNGYDAPLDKLPLFVRGGAILPLWPAMNYPGELPADPMTLELWPAGNSSFELYEDDGVTRQALNASLAAFGRTLISMSAPLTYLSAGAGSQNVTVTIGGVSGGGFAGQLASRGWWLNVRCRNEPLEVLLTLAGGAAPSVLPEMQSEAQLELASAGWYHDTSLQPGAGGLLMVKLSAMPAAQGFAITLSNGPVYQHIGTEACDTVLHHMVDNQKFAWDEGSSRFTVVQPAAGGGGGAAQCLTIGKDKDEEAHTPALEVQPCSSPALDAVQQFTYLPASTQFTLKADGSQCLDQDVSDMRVILYGCHDAASPGNQAWAYNASTQHIVSLANGDCMAVMPVA